MELEFSHIGIACKDITKEAMIYNSLGYKQCGDIFIDKTQKIKGLFMKKSGNPTIELVENLTTDGPLTNFIKNNTKLYHTAYKTDKIDVLKFTKLTNAKPISKINSATYFSKVCFFVLPNMQLIELVETK